MTAFVFYHLPDNDDGSAHPADIVEIFAELEREEADRMAWAEARLRIANGTHSQATREHMADCEREDTQNSEMAEPPKPRLEVVGGTSINKTPANDVHRAYAKNDRGQNTIFGQPVAKKIALATLPVFNAMEDDGSPIEPPEWLIQDWLPVGRVTLLYANGGVGKTTSAQQLMTACQSGRPWFGMRAKRCKTIALLCEDEIREIRWRQRQINEHLGIGMRDLGETHWMAGVGEDNTLVTFDRSGLCSTTERFAQLRELALSTGARLIVIDGAASTFGNGNENDRAQVVAFINKLTKLAMEINGSILLLAHPSRAGMLSGTNDSGSTHWHNSCRSRWSLVCPVVDGMEDEFKRVLKLEKANWAQRGLTVSVNMVEGILVAETLDLRASGDRKDAASAAFLAGLRQKRREGLHMSQHKTAPRTYAPRVLANTPECRDFKPNELLAAMNNLLKSGVIKTASYRHNYKDCEHLIIVGEELIVGEEKETGTCCGENVSA